MQREPKYRQAIRLFEERILSGEWPAGLPTPPIRKLMKSHAISLATVNRALDDLEKRGRVVRMAGRGIFVLPAVTAAAPPSPDANTKPLHVMVLCDWRKRPEAPTMWWTRLLRGIEGGLHGGTLKLASPSDFDSPRDLADALRRQEIEAVVNMGDHWSGARLADFARAVRQAGRNMVMVWSGQPRPLPAPSVDVDNREGLFAAMEHLAGLGHRRIAFVGFDAPHAWLALREQAYREAAASLGIDPVLHRLPTAAGETGERQPAGFPEKETAFVCANDDTAVRVLRLLGEKGIRVPEDVSVTGFDDDYQHRRDELTTARADLERIGREAADLLADLRAGRWGDRTPHLLIPAPLVIRHTTAAPPPEADA